LPVSCKGKHRDAETRSLVLDSDVLVDFLGGFPPAVAWLTGYTAPIGVPGLVALQLLQGCRNLAEQQQVERELQRFTIYWPTMADCQRAYRDFSAYHLSDGLEILDVLSCHTALGLNEPLATFHAKHYGVIGGLQTVQPY
jgi:predicted nucleic acid-binding protein